MQRTHRQHIYFSAETLEALKNYARKRYGAHWSISAIVQRAVILYLMMEEDNERYKGKEGLGKLPSSKGLDDLRIEAQTGGEGCQS
uniref:Uncharacterized protein n=1 Tax=viral metagenome TaxID=1070528 RepID=A0A6H2A068_9ZZZZ